MDNPTCPACSAPMVLRHANATGRPFYGCSRYPACRGIVNIKREQMASRPVEKMVHPDLAMMERELKRRKYAWSTEKNYLHMVSEFLTYRQKAGPGKTDEIYANDFIMLLILMDKLAGSSINLYLAALGFLFNHVYKKPLDVKAVPRVKEEKKIPKVLSKEQVFKVVNTPPNFQHQLMLKTCYSCGLRVGELVRVKIIDISFDRDMLKVIHGKGKKERRIPISAELKALLAPYVAGKDPQSYLFPNQHVGGGLSVRSAENTFKTSCEKHGITGDFGIHILRHSFATHLLEAGTSIKVVQELLGHSRVTTTEIYSHISMANLIGVTNSLKIGSGSCR